MRAFLLTLSALVCTSCSTQDLGGVTTASAILVAIPLAPAAEAYHAVAGVSRTLTVIYVYRMKEGVYALSNDDGWFTDRSEQQIRANHHTYLSAWVVDLAKSPKDKKGRIVLSESNLDRWFFRDTNVNRYQRLPNSSTAPSAESNSNKWIFSDTAVNGYQRVAEGSTDPSGEYYTSNPGEDFITIHTADGSAHVLLLPRQK